MLTLSREARVKVGRHAWNVFPLEAFGFLLGSKADGAVYAALPCSKTRCWREFEDRWTGLYNNTEKACSVGKLFNMEVVGFYASTESLNRDEYPMPAFIASTSMELVLLYQTICCPGHSWASLKSDNRWLIRDEDYVVPRGIRISDSISQKRIHKEWCRIFGLVDYSNQPHHHDMAYKLYDIVTATEALPEFGICIGMTGVIVDVYPDGEVEVEFCGGNGETIALVAMRPSHIAPAGIRKAV